VRARPDDEKWGRDILNIKYTTMKPNETDNDLRIKTYFRPGLANAAIPRAQPEVVNMQTRRCRLYPEDFVRHGTTIGCAGCRAINRRSKDSENHTERCRKRIESELMKYPEGRTRVEAANLKMNQAVMERIEATMTAAEGEGASSTNAEVTTSEPRRRRRTADPDREGKRVRIEESGGGADAMEDVPTRVPSPGEPMVLEMPAAPGTPLPARDMDGDLEIDRCVLEGCSAHDELELPNLLVIESGSHRYNNPHDLSEIYSPPRVTKMARQMGLKGGWALDLTTVDEGGEPWDFNLESCRVKAKKLIQTSKPTVLIGSPECKWFSQLQTLNKMHYKDPEAAAQCLKNAIGHMEFVAELYEMQLKAGRYFLHEHPSGASSWGFDCMKKLASHPKVIQTKVHMCALDCSPVIVKETGW